KAAQASRGTLSAMRRLARTSTGSMRSTSSNAFAASISSASRTPMLSRRSALANRASVAVSMPLVRGAGEEIADHLGPGFRDVGFGFEHTAERRSHHVGVQAIALQAQERPRPVDGLGHSGYLGQFAPPQLLHESRDHASEMLVQVRHLAAQYANLLFFVGMLDVEIQAAAAQRVADLARPIGSQHDV